MPRLLCDGKVVAEVEIADTSRKRLIGLLRRDSLEGALLLPRTNSVHTLHMRFAIDVAYCNRDAEVIDIVTMQPNRMGRPRFSAKYVVEAAAGAFDTWGVNKGSTLEAET